VMGNIILLILIVVLLTFNITNDKGDAASLVGLLVSYALTMTGKLNWLVRNSVDTENQMNTIERCTEYCKLEPEWLGDPYSSLSSVYVDYTNQPGKEALVSNTITKTMLELINTAQEDEQNAKNKYTKPTIITTQGYNYDFKQLNNNNDNNNNKNNNVSTLSKTQTELLTMLPSNPFAPPVTFYTTEGIITQYEQSKISPNVPSFWPQFGNIVLKNVFARYRPKLPLVVKGISCNLTHQVLSHHPNLTNLTQDELYHAQFSLTGKRVAIVGRTGAGKSSLIQLLLRLVNTSSAIDYHHHCQTSPYHPAAQLPNSENNASTSGNQIQNLSGQVGNNNNNNNSNETINHPQKNLEPIEPAELDPYELRQRSVKTIPELLAPYGGNHTKTNPNTREEAVSLLHNSPNSDNYEPVKQPAIEPSGISIDGIDIATIPLNFLRQNICVVPQEPILFSRSIRFNLTPEFSSIEAKVNDNDDDDEDENMKQTLFDLGYSIDELIGKIPLQLSNNTYQSNKKPIPLADIPIWKVLNQVQLITTVASLPGGLDYRLKSPTHLFSLGQRQLLCLARTMLKLFNYNPVQMSKYYSNLEQLKQNSLLFALPDHTSSNSNPTTLQRNLSNSFPTHPNNNNDNNDNSIPPMLANCKKILLLDEATSSVDTTTENMMNNIIRDITATTKCTVISIAHHLHAILDYDLVIVMEFGEIAEVGHPKTLLSHSCNQNVGTQTKFFKLVASETSV